MRSSLGICGMALQKPQRQLAPRQPKKKEMFAITPSNRTEVAALLKSAAERAQYTGSPYHRTAGSKMGSKTDRRWPDASKCDPDWTRDVATGSLRRAIADGTVSRAWQNGFPRLVWYLHEGVLYEARLSNSVSGEYHAYPLEDQREWPKELRRPRTSTSE
jgi:hypothetical protein